jgi:hypothetical protein
MINHAESADQVYFDRTPITAAEHALRRARMERYMARVIVNNGDPPAVVDHLVADYDDLKKYNLRNSVHMALEDKKRSAIHKAISAISFIQSHIDAKTLRELNTVQAFVEARENHNVFEFWLAIPAGLTEQGAAFSLASHRFNEGFVCAKMRDDEDIVVYITRWNELHMKCVEYRTPLGSDEYLAMQFLQSLAPRYVTLLNVVTNQVPAIAAPPEAQRIAKSWVPIATRAHHEVAAVASQGPKRREQRSKVEIKSYPTDEWEKLTEEDKEVIREGFAQRRKARRNRRKEGKPKPMVAQHASVHHPGCCNHGNDDDHVHHPDLQTHALILQDEEST